MRGLGELHAESLPGDILGDLSTPVLIAKTASRQMLGFMNEMARFAEYDVINAYGLARCDIDELNRHQRRMLHNRDSDHVRPIELERDRQR